MPLFTILVVLTLAGSLIFCVITLKRLLAYNKKYRLPELSYTKLFKVIKKEHVAVVYLAFNIATSIFMIWFLWTL